MAARAGSGESGFDLLFLDHPVPMWVYDLETLAFLEVNNAAVLEYGYTRGEFLAMTIKDIRPPDDVPLLLRNVLEKRAGLQHSGEWRHRTKDGLIRDVEITSHLIDYRGRRGSLVIAHDITSRKKTEEQFRLMAENVGDLVAVVDREGRRVYNSPSYEAILGDTESLKGTSVFRDIHPDDRDRARNVFEEIVRTGIPQRISYRMIAKDGSVREVESKGGVIRDGSGMIIQGIVVSRDVTEEKKLAAQFLRAQRMQSIGTLAGGIAHDLNNVLSPIIMAIEILRRRSPDERSLKLLETIDTSAKRGADIVRQVLAFGRGIKGERDIVQLRHVIAEVVAMMRETFPKSIEIKTEIDRDLRAVSADATQMHQVLVNLMVNARDAMAHGGVLTVSAENVTLDENYARMHIDARPGSYVHVAVSDSGTGISPEIREKIFEPFFTTKEVGMGTGLGLSTTLAIVRSHQGFINLYTEEGRGTTFGIYVPATVSPSSLPAGCAGAELPAGNGELILVIDDELAIREITRVTLESYGYNVVAACNGAEGVSEYGRQMANVKLVITDIMMPVMDGTDTIRALQRMNPAVKIIAASGLATAKSGPPVDEYVLAYLAKPYTAETLLAAVTVALQ